MSTACARHRGERLSYTSTPQPTNNKLCTIIKLRPINTYVATGHPAASQREKHRRCLYTMHHHTANATIYLYMHNTTLLSSRTSTTPFKHKLLTEPATLLLATPLPRHPSLKIVRTSTEINLATQGRTCSHFHTIQAHLSAVRKLPQDLAA